MKKSEQKSRSKNFSKKFDYNRNTPIPVRVIKTTKTIPITKDILEDVFNFSGQACFIYEDDLELYLKKRKRGLIFNWIFLVVVSCFIGAIAGIVLTKLL